MLYKITVINMVNILLEGYNISEPWLYDELKNYIKPYMKVAVLALAFRDSKVKSNSDWLGLYGRSAGKYYSGIVGGFTAYGIDEDNITFINYFTDTKDTAAQKIKSADIIYFLGGLPDRMMDRINELNLYDILLNHSGIIMGYSAGALIQLSEYHITPDDDYKEFNYYEGIPYISDFFLEVHFENSREQYFSTKRLQKEKDKPIFATRLGRGAIVVDGDEIKTLGDVKFFG